MSIERFSKGKAFSFVDHTALPSSGPEADRWQELNRSWWQANPMRYDENEPVRSPQFSREFYHEIDKRFYSNARLVMPWGKVPFDTFIPFSQLPQKDVLEIGVGNGSHAQLLSQFAKSFTGIDITNYAVESTRKRFELFELNGRIAQMDAEQMEFPDNSFDFIWSWGVIHHTSNTANVIREMQRVLRPGGTAVVMVYHRSPYNLIVRAGLYYGILRGDLLKGKSLDRILQDNSDGAIARYYTRREWEDLVAGYFAIRRMTIIGSKSQLIPLPWGRAKEAAMQCIPNKLAQWLCNRPSIGFMLVAEMNVV